MRRAFLPILLLATLYVMYPGSQMYAQPKGKSVTLEGELIDCWCYFEDGSKGPKHAECAKTCAKLGNPIGLLTKDDKVYILSGMKDHQPAKDLFVNHMGKMVTVKGTLVTKAGINMLYATSVTPQKAAAKAKGKM